MIQRRLSAPADKEGGGDMCLGPVHDFHQLRPVINLFKFHLLHRRPGNDKAVKAAPFYLTEWLVEFIDMTLGRILGLVGAYGEKGDFKGRMS